MFRKTLFDQHKSFDKRLTSFLVFFFSNFLTQERARAEVGNLNISVCSHCLPWVFLTLTFRLAWVSSDRPIADKPLTTTQVSERLDQKSDGRDALY